MTSRSRSSAASSINYLGFNSDASCFSVGGEKGLSVFGSLPLKPLLVDEGLLEEREEAYDDDGDGDTPANSLRHSRTKIASAAASSMQRGLGCVALLERSNIVLLTTASTMRNPMFPPNRLLGWDDAHKRRIFEIEFSSDILNVKVCRTR